MMIRLDADHFRACMIGGAVGDAMGAPIEFMSLVEIMHRFGPAGVRDVSDAIVDEGVAHITDDTQMALFTAEGLIRGANRSADSSISNLLPLSPGEGWIEVIRHAYVRWLHTQGQKSGIESFDGDDDGWLIALPGLHQSRAPGTTCLSALKSGRRFDGLDVPVNDSKGCGGVMRVAPVGLFVPPESAFEAGCETAAITHGHPTGFLAAGFLASLIASIINGCSLEEAIRRAADELTERRGHQECLEAVEGAVTLANAERTPAGAGNVESLGEGWVAEEALSIALYCTLVSGEDFAAGIRLAVNHGGDSDSTGAIAGNIMGALHGMRVIPPSWVDSIEMHEEIEEIALDLFTARESGRVDREKYPPW